MRNKIVFTILSLLTLMVLFFYQMYKLPHGFRLTKMDLQHYIHDNGGMTILAEGYNISGDEKLPMVKEMVAYSKNKLGFVVLCRTSENLEVFVLIKPKVQQDYLPELVVDYVIFSRESYEKKQLRDFWIKIR